MALESGLDVTLRRAGRQLATGLCAAPVVDVADDHGILGGLARLDLDAVSGVSPGAWLWLAFFAVVGAAFARLFFEHGATGRKLFVLTALLPACAFWLVGGLRLSVMISVLFLALGYVTWSIAGLDSEREPTAP